MMASQANRLTPVCISVFAILLSSQAVAAGHKISAGAASIAGGSNPVSFTALAEYSYTYINGARDREIVVGLIPGLAYAVRFAPHKDVSVSVGASLSLAPSSFVGLYSGFGWEFWCISENFCMNMEFRTATALYSMKRNIYGLSSVSLGGTLWTN